VVWAPSATLVVHLDGLFEVRPLIEDLFDFRVAMAPSLHLKSLCAFPDQLLSRSSIGSVRCRQNFLVFSPNQEISDFLNIQEVGFKHVHALVKDSTQSRQNLGSLSSTPKVP